MTITDYMPTLDDLTAAVIDTRNDAKTYEPQDIADDEGNPSIDVRLQVVSEESSYRSTGWTFHTGDASFDQDGSGAWGASSVAPTDTDDDCRSIAEDLIDQVIEDHARAEATQ